MPSEAGFDARNETKDTKDAQCIFQRKNKGAINEIERESRERTQDNHRELPEDQVSGMTRIDSLVTHETGTYR